MNRYKISLFGTMVCLLGVGFSDTAIGQTLTAQPTSLTFNVAAGGATATQNITVSNSGGFSTTVNLSLAGSQSWLTVDGISAPKTSIGLNTAANGTLVLPVTVNTAGLQLAQYSTSFTVQISGESGAGALLTYAVVLNVGGSSLLSASPATVAFSAVQGAQVATPNAGYPITITSSAQQLSYTVSAATQANTGNWILLSSGTGTTSASTAGFTVQVNPTGLTVGMYTGSITVQSTTTSDSVSIPVTLSVTTGAVLNVTGTLNNFVFQVNSGSSNFSQETQNLMISTTTGDVSFQVTPTATSGPGGLSTTTWLLLSQNSGVATTTPQVLSLSLSSFLTLSSLPTGTYTINLAIAPIGTAGNTTNVAVTLIVTNSPPISISTSTVSFSATFGSTSTQMQTINVTANGSAVPYVVTTSTNSSWLSVSPASGTTPSSFAIIVNPSGLAVSSTPYTGTVTVFPDNEFNTYNLPITVSLTVTGPSTQISAAPAALLFSYESTKTVPTQQLVELISASPVAFSVATSVTTASNCPSSNWLSFAESASVTPATLSIGVSTSGMTAGTCSGNVTVSYNNGTASSTVIIPVTVNIASTSLLTVTPNPGFGVFTATAGSTAVMTSMISVNSTDGSALSFAAGASTPGAPVSWLLLGSSFGTTQQYIQVEIAPSGLPVGVYNGSITISATNFANLPSGSFTLPVVLTVSASTTVSVTPTSLSFAQTSGGTPPASQAISLTAAGGSTTYTAAITPITGGNWLQISAQSGTVTATASNLTASVAQNTLTPGTYSSSITLTFLNSATPPVTIPVSLVVSAAAQVVTVAPNGGAACGATCALNFSYQLGAAAPTTQTLSLASTAGAVGITATASSTGNWLSVTPTAGTTPVTLTVSVSTVALTLAQTYTGTITITPANQSPITVQVSVVVTGVPAPQPSTIGNSASQAFGAIAPGELISIFGINLGPATALQFSVGPGETLSNTLAGVQVLFDNIPGTPIYVSAKQINVIVPYEIAGRSSTNIVVSYQGELSAAIPQNVASEAPGIFTFSSTGSGQASVLNQNFSFNGPPTGLVVNGATIQTTPAAPGSVIVVYMTGGGQTTPASVTGTVTPSSPLYEIPLSSVTATIGGVNAPVQFAGAAPGEVTGVIQLNITVPTNAAAVGNALPLVVTINGVPSPSGPTVAVN